MLEIRHLNVANRLKQINVTIPQGQLVGLIGPNGAGKSTLLQSLAGLTAADTGEVVWNRNDLMHCSAYVRRQHMAYLPQFTRFSEPVAVADLLQLSQVNIQAQPEQLRSWRTKATQHFVVEELTSRVITELSGGEQRRVALACLAASNRAILLLDEPVAGLDLYHQLLTMDWLKSAAAAGATVIVAMHDLALAGQYCDQLLLLKHTQQLAFGAPNEVLSDTNLASAFQVSVDWLCNDAGVAMLAKRLTD